MRCERDLKEMLRIIALCVAVAMICALLRVQRPEIAMVISLAAGMAAICGLWSLYHSAEWFDFLKKLFSDNSDVYKAVFKAAGIGILAEFCKQVCEDAGEKALAGRIGLISRISMLSVCGPMLNELLTLFGEKVI